MEACSIGAAITAGLTDAQPCSTRDARRTRTIRCVRHGDEQPVVPPRAPPISSPRAVIARSESHPYAHPLTARRGSSRVGNPRPFGLVCRSRPRITTAPSRRRIRLGRITARPLVVCTDGRRSLARSRHGTDRRMVSLEQPHRAERSGCHDCRDLWPGRRFRRRGSQRPRVVVGGSQPLTRCGTRLGPIAG
jgi:hypothetical protein